LDCGGQYIKVIDRRVRELCVHSEILPVTTPASKLTGYDAIILSGGPESVYAPNSPRLEPGVVELGKPILGICYGMQLLAKEYGGVVEAGGTAEYGVEEMSIATDSALFDGLPRTQRVLMSHGDHVKTVGPGFRVSARSENFAAAMEHPEKRVYGVQFHPEVDLTEFGTPILKNFLEKVCKLERNYVLDDRIQSAIAAIRKQVGDNPVVVLVSGGVDSAVSAVLLVKALGPERVHALHIDHGFMRKAESDEICEALTRMGIEKLTRVNAEDLFFSATTEHGGKKIGPITQLQDSEYKRVLIGDSFLTTLNDHIRGLNLDPDNTYFAQGTLRPDLIESGNPGISSVAHKIKTHHNDVELIRRARERGHVVETNADWHKDEVRRVARTLGIPAAIAERQPFPGPGLALRVMTYDGVERVSDEEQQKLDQILQPTRLSGTILPVRTVGVQGDHRTYRFLGVVSGDNAARAEAPELSRKITNAHKSINRVAFTVGEIVDCKQLKANACWLSKNNVDAVREADAIVRQALADLHLSQVLAIYVPVSRTGQGFSVAIRTFITNDFMTGRFALPGSDITWERIETLARELKAHVPGVDLVLYDLTSKPPATVEWQ